MSVSEGKKNRVEWPATSELPPASRTGVEWPATSELPPAASRVVVAMSGGVDSSVAAYLLAQQGISIVGVAMQVWDYKKTSSENSRATCCSPADFCDARMVASKLSIPFYVVDFEKIGRAHV